MMCEALAALGAKVTVFTTNANGFGRSLDVPTDRPVEVNGVEVHYFPLSWPARLIPFYVPALGRACRAKMNRFDVAYLFGTWTYSMWAGARAAWKTWVPYVVSPRGAFMTRSRQEKWIKKRLYFSLIERTLVNRATVIHCTSEMERQQMEQLAFRPDSILIPNGLDLVPFASLPAREIFLEMIGLSDNTLLSIFVGRLAPEKRLELTVEAFAEVARQLPTAHLAIIGAEAGSGEISRGQVEALNISDRVHFVGFLTGHNLLQAYAAADLLVLLSRRENFGMVVVEAMAAGLPVLLSNEVGLAGQVKQAGAGYIVSPQKEEIVQSWVQILSASDRQEMGTRGRMLVQQHFSQEVVTAQMLALLERVASHKLLPNR